MRNLLAVWATALSPRLGLDDDAVAASQERTRVTGSSSANASDDGHFDRRIHDTRVKDQRHPASRQASLVDASCRRSISVLYGQNIDVSLVERTKLVTVRHSKEDPKNGR